VLKKDGKIYLTKEWKEYPAMQWIPLCYDGKDPWQESRTIFFSNFISALDGNGPVPVSGEEALDTLEVVLATYESAATGKVVNL